jgi:hypothetical protein
MTLDELKKQLFVDEAAIDTKVLEEAVLKLVQYARLDKGGRVLLLNSKLTDTNKIKITLVARYIANKLDENISSDISPSEAAQSLFLNPKTAAARMGELVQGGFASRNDHGKYKVHAYNILPFLNSLSPLGDSRTIKIRGEEEEPADGVSISSNELDVAQVHTFFDGKSFETGPEVLLDIGCYLTSKEKRSEFRLQEIAKVYDVLINLGVKVPLLQYVEQSVRNMTRVKPKYFERAGRGAYKLSSLGKFKCDKRE